MDIDYDDIAQGVGNRDTVIIAHDGAQRVSDMAALFLVDGKKRWVPKSVIVECDEDTAIVHRWWAKKEGLG